MRLVTSTLFDLHLTARETRRAVFSQEIDSTDGNDGECYESDSWMEHAGADAGMDGRGHDCAAGVGSR